MVVFSVRQEVLREGFNLEGELGSETRDLEGVEAMEVGGAITEVTLMAGVSMATGVEIGEHLQTVMDIRGLKTLTAMVGPV